MKKYTIEKVGMSKSAIAAKIESSLNSRRRGRKPGSPLQTAIKNLKVGESFRVNVNDYKNMNSLAVSAHVASVKLNVRIATSKEQTPKNTFLRIFKIGRRELVA